MTSSTPTSDADADLIDVQRLTAADAHWVHDALSELLCDVVDHDGEACVGFLAPLSREDAGRYWVDLQPTLDDNHALWIARVSGRVVGAVQLHGCNGPDATHRADVSHLVVRADTRSHGVTTALMAALEHHALGMGRSLLVLDVDSDSAAATVFARLGWRHAGNIPDYATSTRGALRAFARLYKPLQPPRR